jgi:hypothetical protein
MKNHKKCPTPPPSLHPAITIFPPIGFYLLIIANAQPLLWILKLIKCTKKDVKIVAIYNFFLIEYIIN